MKFKINLSLCLLFVFASGWANADGDWRVLDPDNTLIIESNKGRIVIEMRPEMAPKAVERIKLLAREKIYDGLQFHRVIASFVAQTGNPNNRDGGGTSHPNVPPEMVFKYKINSGELIATNSSDSASGFLGSTPFQSTPITETAKKGNSIIRAWGAHCPGTVGMGRNEARDSANSEIYFMLDSSRRLDRDYTLFGRVVVGMDILLSLERGEPPAKPDIMLLARILADIPVEQRPKVRVMAGSALEAVIHQTRQEKAADFSICDVIVPARVD